MKRKTTFAISVLVLLAGFNLTASAQDKMKNQPSTAASATEKMSSYQASQQKLSAAKMMQSGKPDSPAALNVSKIENEPSDVRFQIQRSAPKSMEQLRYERKQAAEKGLSTEKYDAAINEIILNQSK